MRKRPERQLNPDDTIKSFSSKRMKQHQHEEKPIWEGMSSNSVKDIQKSISNQTDVSTTLATHLLSKKFRKSNMVFSPLSLHVVLSILANGSKGRTLDQLLAFLKVNTTCELNSLYSWLVPFMFVDGSQNGGPQLSFANGVWVGKTMSLKPSFKDVVDTTYDATCKQVDFSKAKEVANEVNKWAKKQTNGLIKKVLNSHAIDALTLLIFSNAVYFKGTWTKKLDKSRTEKFDFHLLNGNKVKVPFMTSNKRQYVHEYDNFKVLGLPYFRGRDNRKFTMYFFLPNANGGLRSLIKQISSTSDFLDCHIPHKKVKVRNFLLPKFTISTGFEASNMLKNLGLVLPFNNVGDFTEMDESAINEQSYVSAIHQKSFVEVNEEGTEAASVSTVMRMLRCAQKYAVKEDFIDFVADHPFFFVIREVVSGVVLFMGHVTDPSIVDQKGS